jgi:GNAT superfamily N-acetyltransferase
VKSRYGLEIRAATVADASGLAELLGHAGVPVGPRSVSGRLDALRHETGTVLIALEWGPPSGIVELHWYRTLEQDQPTAQITMLLVDPDARRRGIGRLLVKAASQAARVAGCDALELLATAERADLHGFCQNTGFVETGRHFRRPLRKTAAAD